MTTDAEIYDAWIVAIDGLATGEFQFKRLPLPHGTGEQSRNWWLANLVRENLLEPTQLHSTFGQLHKRTNKIKQVLDAGGWAKYQIKIKEEEIANASDKELVRLMNKSVIDTNASIAATNTSIQRLNDKTEKIYSFQKATTILTVVVGIAAVVVPSIQWFHSNKTDTIEHLQRQQQADTLLQRFEALTNQLNDTIPVTLVKPK